MIISYHRLAAHASILATGTLVDAAVPPTIMHSMQTTLLRIEGTQAQHSTTLAQHSLTLAQHSSTLAQHTEMLIAITENVRSCQASLARQELLMQDMTGLTHAVMVQQQQLKQQQLLMEQQEPPQQQQQQGNA